MLFLRKKNIFSISLIHPLLTSFPLLHLSPAPPELLRVLQAPRLSPGPLVCGRLLSLHCFTPFPPSTDLKSLVCQMTRSPYLGLCKISVFFFFLLVITSMGSPAGKKYRIVEACHICAWNWIWNGTHSQTRWRGISLPLTEALTQGRGRLWKN